MSRLAPPLLSLGPAISIYGSDTLSPHRFLSAACVKHLYGSEYDDWLEYNPGIKFSPYYMNPLIVRAWAKFEERAKPIIIKAAKKCGLSPLNANAENFQGSEVSVAYDLVAADKEAAAPTPAAAALTTTETNSKLTVLQLKSASPDSTLVIRSSAASFFATAYVKPATELQREIKEQRDLKKQTAPLDDIDRAVPETSVGRWVSTGLLARLKENGDSKRAALEEKKEKQIENQSKKAQAHVALLNVGEATLVKLRADRQVRHLLPRTPPHPEPYRASPSQVPRKSSAQADCRHRHPGVAFRSSSPLRSSRERSPSSGGSQRGRRPSSSLCSTRC